MSMARQRPTAHGMSVSSTIFHPWYPFWERAFEATYLVKQPTLNDRIDFRVLHLLAMKTNIRSASAVWNSYKPLMWDLRVHQTDHVSLSTSWIENGKAHRSFVEKTKVNTAKLDAFQCTRYALHLWPVQWTYAERTAVENLSKVAFHTVHRMIRDVVERCRTCVYILILGLELGM